MAFFHRPTVQSSHTSRGTFFIVYWLFEKILRSDPPLDADSVCRGDAFRMNHGCAMHLARAKQCSIYRSVNGVLRSLLPLTLCATATLPVVAQAPDLRVETH